jgi:hypothetical protein
MPLSNRVFVPNQPLRTSFGYSAKAGLSESWLRSKGIASEAECVIRATGEPIMNAQLTKIDPEKHSMEFDAEYYNKGVLVYKAHITRNVQSGIVIDVVYDGMFRSAYQHKSGDRIRIPAIKTTRMDTGELVSETKNVHIEGDGSFMVEEVNYENREIRSRFSVRRHAGTGLLIEQKALEGLPDADYHHYELLVDTWTRRDL